MLMQNPAAFFGLYFKYSGLRVTNMPRGYCWIVKGYVVWGLDMRFLGQKREK